MNRIRILRQHYDMSLVDLSGISGVSVGYISEIERGIRSDPALSVCRAIAHGLLSSVDYVFPDSDDVSLTASKKHLEWVSGREGV